MKPKIELTAPYAETIPSKREDVEAGWGTSAWLRDVFLSGRERTSSLGEYPRYGSGMLRAVDMGDATLRVVDMVEEGGFGGRLGRT